MAEDVKKDKEVPEVISEESTAGAEEIAPETPPAPKHKYADRLSKAYPDRQFESDEDFDNGLEEYLGELEGYKDRGVSMNKKLIALFEAEPWVGELVRDMMNGATGREALARHFSPEDLTPIEGDPDYEGWTKNKTDREERANKRRAFEDEYAKNLEFSQAAIEEFAAENGMELEAAGKYLEKFDSMLAEINSGKITKEALSAIKKAFDYDNDLATAKTTGEVAGRNQNIIAKKETAKNEGDGLPRPSKSAEVPDTGKRQPHFMEDLLQKVNKQNVL